MPAKVPVQHSPAPVTLYDTTLRDGAQGEGINFSLSDKLRIAERLDHFGMHYIEGGFAGSNPKDLEFFHQARKIQFKNARLAVFGMTRKAHGSAKNDAQVAALLAAETPVVTVVGKSSDMQVREILGTTLEENLAMISDTIAYLKNEGREVIFDGEHLFDGYKLNAAYTLACCQAAVDAGASYVVLCDTNGGTLPGEITRITAEILIQLPWGVKVGIHTHDDCGLSVANSLASIEAGATQVQGTINGYGERTGNCNLVTVIPNLQLKMNRPVVSDDNLRTLRDLSIFVDEVANQRANSRAPFVGTTAFAHKGGMHANAVSKLTASYEHIEPARVGNQQRILVGELAGRSNVVVKARQMGLELNEKHPAAKQVLEEIKRLEGQGYEFEAADASFELLVKKVLNKYQPFFDLVKYHVSIRKDTRDTCEATLKLQVGENKTLATAVEEGDGPVNALDKALRTALLPHCPKLSALHLVDYKVRIVDSTAGTGACTRVLIESSDGEANWTTVGVSTDIIEASWLALRDSVDYYFSKLGT